MDTPTPDDEAQRIAELRGLELLDTPAEERFDRITRIAKRVFGTKMALVSLVDADRQWFKSSQGLDITETPRAISFCGHALMSDEPLVVDDASHDPLVVGRPDIRLYVGQPIHGPTGRRIGTLCVLDTKPREVPKDELTILKDLAILVENELRIDVLTVSEKQLRQSLSAAERKASIDPLTRAWTRDASFQLFDLELERRSQRGESAPGMAMVDVDHFKSVNDTHGHPVGDQVLTTLVARVRSALRDQDLVGRYGGEEFVVLFGGSDPAALRAVAERIREAVAHAPFPIEGGELNVTVSVGLCCGKPSGTSRDALIAMADRALYAAKRNGRNRVEVSTE